MTVTDLESIRAYFAEQVLSTLQLKVPREGNLHQYALVTPTSHIGWIPPGGVLAGDTVSIPCLVVGLDKEVLSEEDTQLFLRLTCAVYDPGEQLPKEDANTFLPNFAGYRTLLNFMDRIAAQTMKQRVIAGRYELISAVELKMYEEQPYPFWYGYLQFTLQCQEYPSVRYAAFLK